MAQKFLTGATFSGNIRLPSSGKLYTWTGHDDNYLRYDLWRASASAGMTIHNISADGEIYLKSGNATALTLDSSQNATFAGDIKLADNNKIKGTTYSAGFISFESDGETRISANDDVVIGYGETLNISNTGVSTFAGNVILENASSPKIDIKDTTNNVLLSIYSQNSNSIIGTYSNHPLKLFSNSSEAVEFDTSQNATFAGNLNLAEYIYHDGDDDTYIRFVDDRIDFRAGNLSFIDIREDTNNYGYFNVNAADIDFQFRGTGNNNLIRTDAANDRVGLGGVPFYAVDLHLGTANAVRVKSQDDISQIRIEDDDTTAFFGVKDDKAFISFTGGTPSSGFFIDSSGNGTFAGNLGISGAAVDSSKALRIKSQSTSSQSSAIEVMDNSDTNAIIRMGEKSTDGARLHMFDGGSEKIAFYTDGTHNHISSGDVSIGRSSQLGSAKLSIQADAGEDVFGVQCNSNNTTTKLINIFNSSGTDIASITINNDATPDMLFNVDDGSGNITEVLKLDSSQNATFAGNIRTTEDIGRDDHNRIMFSTDDSIIYRIADTHRFRMDSDNFSPYADSSYDLGTSSLYFRAAYIDAITTTGNVTVGGDLTVNGTTTTVNQTNLDVSDNIIGLNRGLTGANANDSGIIIERGSSGDNAAFIWDESIGYFSFGTTQKTPSATGAVANESDWSWKPIKASGAVFTGDITTNGDIIIDNSSGDPFLKLKTSAQEWVVRIDQSDSEKFQIRNVTGTTTSLSIDTSSNATFAGSVTIDSDTAKLYLGADDDMHIYHTGSDGYVLNKTGDLEIINQESIGDILFKTKNSDGNVVTPLTLDSGGAATFAGDVNISTGSHLFFDGGNSGTYITEDIADRLRIFVGATEFMRLTESTSDTINIYKDTTFAGDVIIEGDDKDFYVKSADHTISRIINRGTGADLDKGLFSLMDTGTEDVRIDTGGNSWINTGYNFGIGTTSPAYLLSVEGSANDDWISRIYNTNTNGAGLLVRTDATSANDKIALGVYADSGYKMVVRSTGDVGIGTTSPSATLHIADAANSGVTSLSANGRITLSGDGVIKWGASANYGTLTWDSSKAIVASQGSNRLHLATPGNADALVVNGGNIGIATNSPIEKLQAAGAIISTGSNSTSFTAGAQRAIMDLTSNGARIGHFRGTETAGSGSVKIYSDSTLGITLDASQNTTFAGNISLADSKSAYFGTGSDLQIFHNGSNSHVQNATGDLYIENLADDKDVIFRSDNGSGGFTTYFELDGSLADGTNVGTRFPDQSIILLGSGSGFQDGAQIYHNGTNTIINNYTGHLYFNELTDDGDIIFSSDDGSGGLAEYYKIDGGNEANLFSKNVKLSDSIELRIGSSNDLKIYHDGSNSYIDNNTGWLNIPLSQNGMSIANADFSASIAKFLLGGACELYYDGSKKIETTSAGITVTGTIVKSGGTSSQFLMADGSVSTSSFSGGTVANAILLPHGSTSAPSIGTSVNGNTNTGMYWPTDHQLGFTVNNSRKFYMSETRAFFQNLSSGVHINSSSDAPLEVQSSDATTGIKFTDNSANAKLYYVGSGNYFYTDAHRLGIGDVTAPSVALHVVGTDNVSSRFIFTKDLSTDKILFGGADHDTFGAPFIGSSSAHSFTITQGGGAAITIDTSKKVGIGTTSPAYKVEINDDTANGRAIQAVQSATSGTNYGFQGGAYGSGATKNIGLHITAEGATTNVAGVFIGDVGVGTSSPSKKLEIDSGTQSDIAKFGNDNGGFVVGYTTNLASIDLSATTQKFRIRQGSSVPFTIDDSQNATFAGTIKGTTYLVNHTSASGIGASLGDINSAELGPGYLSLSRDDTADAKQIVFEKNDAEHSYLQTTSSGLNIGGANVGIGITSPSDGDSSIGDPKLHVLGVESTGRNLAARFQAGNDSDNTYASMILNHSNDRGLIFHGGRAASNRAIGFINLIQYDGSELTDGITLYQPNTGSSGATSGTNVGIGTTSPEAKLEIMQDGGAIIRLHDPGDNSWKIKADADFHIYDDSNTDYLTITNAGNATFAGDVTVDSEHIVHKGSSPEFYFHTTGNHCNWLIAAQESSNATLEFSAVAASTSLDTNASNYTPILKLGQGGGAIFAGGASIATHSSIGSTSLGASNSYVLDVKKAYSSGNGHVAYFGAGANTAAKLNYDTVVVAQDDVTCLAIIEGNAANTHASEQALRLAVGDNSAVISSTSTASNGMYFYTNRDTNTYGYQINAGTRALHLANTGNATFAGYIHLNGTVNATGVGAEIGRNHAYDTLELKGYGAELMIGAQHTTININYRTCNNGTSNHTPTQWYWRAGTSSNWSDHDFGSVTANGNFTCQPDADSKLSIVNAGTNAVGIYGESGDTIYIGGNNTWQMYLTTNNYVYLRSWMNFAAGEHGVFSSTNNAHFFPNNTISYGVWKISGTRNNYTGIAFGNGGNVVTGMFDSSGNGGDYDQTNGQWHYYWRRDHDCLAVANSTTSSSYGLYVTGAIYSTADVVAYSDRRAKENIVTVDNALDKVSELRGVYYNKKDSDDDKRQVGVIAQEVKEVLPEVVTYDKENDQYGVDYGKINGLLIEAIKDLKKEIEELKQCKKCTDCDCNN